MSTSIKINLTDAMNLAAVAKIAYSRVLKGLPEVDQERVAEALCIAQRGCTLQGISVNDSQRKQAIALCEEQNMRKGLTACIERAERLVKFFDFGRGSCVDAKEGTISFDDYVFLAFASEVKAEDFK